MLLFFMRLLYNPTITNLKKVWKKRRKKYSWNNA